MMLTLRKPQNLNSCTRTEKKLPITSISMNSTISKSKTRISLYCSTMIKKLEDNCNTIK